MQPGVGAVHPPSGATLWKTWKPLKKHLSLDDDDASDPHTAGIPNASTALLLPSLETKEGRWRRKPE